MIAATVASNDEELIGWAQTLQRNCEAHLEDMRVLASLLALPIPSRTGRREEVSPAPAQVAKPEETHLLSVVAKLEEKFRDDLQFCDPVDPAQFRRRGLWHKIRERFFYLFRVWL